MLDDKDIEKLKSILATKEDIASVTAEIQGVSSRLEKVETKLENVETRLESLEERLLVIEAKMVAFEEKYAEMDARLMAMEDKQDAIFNILDRLLLRVEKMNHEYLVMKERDSRYERWFHEIAAKVGVNLIP